MYVQGMLVLFFQLLYIKKEKKRLYAFNSKGPALECSRFHCLFSAFHTSAHISLIRYSWTILQRITDSTRPFFPQLLFDFLNREPR